MGDQQPAVGDRWPLVGRDRQLSALTSIVDGGGESGVVLVGAAGVGKKLHRVSAGNPLLLREILLAGAGHGRTAVPARHVAVDRCGPRDHASRRGGGEPVPVALLDKLVGHEAVATAERKGLATTETQGRRLVARLSHPLYGEIIRSTMATARARSVAGQLADAMTATPMRRRDDALRAGTLQLLSGRTGEP